MRSDCCAIADRLRSGCRLLDARLLPDCGLIAAWLLPGCCLQVIAEVVGIGRSEYSLGLQRMFFKLGAAAFLEELPA